jgi:hypothetical protein
MNPNRKNAQKEITEAPRRYQRNQGQRLQGAASSWKQENNQRDSQEDHRAGDRKESIRGFQRVAKKSGIRLVEGSTPSETKKETAGREGAGKIETPAPPLGKESNVEAMDGNLSGRSGRGNVKMEQCDYRTHCVEKRHFLLN